MYLIIKMTCYSAAKLTYSVSPFSKPTRNKRDRETDKQGETDKQRQTDRQTDRQTS